MSSSVDAPSYRTPWPVVASGFAAASLGALVVSGSLVGVGLSSWAVAKAVALIAVLAALSLPALPLHGRRRLGPANWVTLGRSVVVSGLAALLGESAAAGMGVPIAAVGLLAFGLDWLDGRIARRSGWSTPFGARLDMELDALTVMVLCALAWQLDQAGAWILWAGALRYLFIAASWIWPWMAAELPPDPRRAWVCGLQIASVLLCLLPLPGVLSPLLAAAGTLLVTWSFAVDTAWLVRNR